MKLIIITPKSAVLAFAVLVLSVTAVHAIPTTYVYIGNPFTDVAAPYTTNDFVTAMVTLAEPLPPNTGIQVFPTAFALSDGVQTITNLNATSFTFHFGTGPTGAITSWSIFVNSADGEIITRLAVAIEDLGLFGSGFGGNILSPGTWTVNGQVADRGSTLALMTLTLTALGLIARRFQRVVP